MCVCVCVCVCVCGARGGVSDIIHTELVVTNIQFKKKKKKSTVNL